MPIKLKDICAVVGTYQQNGETKNRYVNVGALMQSDDGGQFIIMERHFNPAGVINPDNRPNLILSCFDPQPKREKTHNQGMQQANQAITPQQKTSELDDLDQEIPF